MQIGLPEGYLPKNLRFLREKYGLSRRALALLVGVEPSVLRRIEQGRTPLEMPLEAFRRLYIIFELSADDLVFFDLSAHL